MNCVRWLTSSSSTKPSIESGCCFDTLAGYLGDLHMFHTVNMTWTLPSPLDSSFSPSPGEGHGFISAGGKLYVHGGVGPNGNAREYFWGGS